ncbi:MAG: aspartate 1-decarboxylase [Armatimonadota bacterium]
MRLVTLLKGKIHRATVTDANVDYIGSITVDCDLLDRSGILVGELVHVWNVTNGERFITYAIAGERHSGIIQINGSAAHRAKRGDKVIIAAFVLTDESVEPQVILVDDENHFLRNL